MKQLILLFKDDVDEDGFQQIEIPVTDWGYRRFAHMQDTLLTDQTVIQKIYDVDENRDWDSLTKFEQDDLIEVWSSAFPMGP